MQNHKNISDEALQALATLDEDAWTIFLESKGTKDSPLGKHAQELLKVASWVSLSKLIGASPEEILKQAAAPFGEHSETLLKRIVALSDKIKNTPLIGSPNDYVSLLGRSCSKDNKARPFLIPIHTIDGTVFELRWALELGLHEAGGGPHKNVSFVLREQQIDELMSLLLQAKAEGIHLKSNLPKS